MMTNFEKAFEIVLKHEGGYGNDPSDSGGPTNFGITQHDLSVHRGHSVSAADVRDMSKEEAGEIYMKRYWAPFHLDQIESFKVAAVIFDQGVLSGPITAIKLAQQAVGVPADGKIGPITLASLNAGIPTEVADKILSLCRAHYESIAANVPKDRKFLRGWENRVDDLVKFVAA